MTYLFCMTFYAGLEVERARCWQLCRCSLASLVRLRFAPPFSLIYMDGRWCSDPFDPSVLV